MIIWIKYIFDDSSQEGILILGILFVTSIFSYRLYKQRGYKHLACDSTIDYAWSTCFLRFECLSDSHIGFRFEDSRLEANPGTIIIMFKYLMNSTPDVVEIERIPSWPFI